VLSTVGSVRPDAAGFFGVVEDVSVRAGQIAQRLIQTAARREALACGVYCYASYCPSGLCPPPNHPTYVNEMSCCNNCTQVCNDYCEPHCTSYCAQQYC